MINGGNPMFDPTAFDNVKFVLEGALYDLDLAGEIFVTDRNDIVNVAKLSRQMEIQVKKERDSNISCTILLRADIVNLAAELHPLVQSEKEAGCHFKMIYCVDGQTSLYKRALEILQTVWGLDREYLCRLIQDPLQNGLSNKIEIEVNFKRLIYEDQMDDLTALATYIKQSLEHLDEGLT
jgi:uncharacterized protein (DUF2344 family)